MKKRFPDEQVDNMETMVFSPDDVRITVTSNDPVVEYVLSFSCSVFSDYASTSIGAIRLFEPEVSRIRPGTYYEPDQTKLNCVVFNKDRKSGYFFDTDTNGSTDFTYAYNEKTEEIEFTVRHSAAEEAEEETVVYSARVHLIDDTSGCMLYIFEPDPDYGARMHLLQYISEEAIDPAAVYRSNEFAEKTVQYMTAVTGSEKTIVNQSLKKTMMNFMLSDGTRVYIDLFTATGHDSDGFDVDLHNIPYLDEGAQSLETLKEWAITDYISKNHDTPDTARARIIENNRVAVILTDEFGYPMDTYTLDALSATGTNQCGELVNLPQTGNNAPAGAAAAAAAVLMMLIGTGTAAGSGVLRREKNHE